MVEIRQASESDLATLPALEAQADQLFEFIGIGPLPAPGSVEVLREARAVLVTGNPPQGFARLEQLAGTAHLEQLSVHPDAMRQGIGRALLRAACAWAREAGYPDITLATYRDVAWNAPFYASEGFVEVGSVDDWYAAHGLSPEEPVLGQFGVRVLMRCHL